MDICKSFLMNLTMSIFVVISPKKFLLLLKEDSRQDNEYNTMVVFKAFWKSLTIVMLSALIGLIIGCICAHLFSRPTSLTITVIQAMGALLLLWGTLFVRGWQLQTYSGNTEIERVNQFLYRTLYILGTAIYIFSVSWPAFY
jgi:hypothetical protein